MTHENFSLHGYDVQVTTKRMATGDWAPEISVTRNGQAVELPRVETVSPNWRTSEEASRAGIEEARRLIDRYLRGHDSQHTDVAMGPASGGTNTGSW